MKKTKYFFIIFVLALLIIPWFPLPQPQLAGVERKEECPSFFLPTYWAGKFQKKFESWWNGHLGSRNTLVIIKNNIYEILNIGQFHTGYSGNILQGKDGTLYEKAYIISKFEPYSPALVEMNAETTISLYTTLKNRLNYMGKQMLLVMAPSKADAREENLPMIFQYRAKYRQTPPSMYPLWEKKLREKEIPYVNALDLLTKKNVLNDSFPDTGTHWAMLAAGLTWEESVRKLRMVNPALPAVKITGEQITASATNQERDIADLLNILPKYAKGNQTWKHAKYQPVPTANSVYAISIGDSFSGQLAQNILQSGFSTSESLAQFENRMPTCDQWFDILAKADLLVLTYTYPKLIESRMKDEASKLLAYTQDIVLKNWHPQGPGEKGQWSKAASQVLFFHSAATDHEISFTKENRFYSKSLQLFVNDRQLSKLDLETLAIPAHVKIMIPKHLLTPGLNIINCIVDGATAPITVLNSQDPRVLGVHCSEIKIYEK